MERVEGPAASRPLAATIRIQQSRECVSFSWAASHVSFLTPWVSDVLTLPSILSVYLRSMTTGEPHPAAKLPDFTWPEANNLNLIHAASITSSRFAIIVENSYQKIRKIFVWNWRTGRILVVSRLLAFVVA